MKSALADGKTMKLDRSPYKGTFLDWRGYLLAIGLVALATYSGHLGRPFLAPSNILMLYLLCVVITAALRGLGPSILACFLGVLAHDYFYLAPFLSFGPPSVQDIPSLMVLLLVGTVISYLTSRVRQQSEDARLHETQTHNLYVLGRNLAMAADIEGCIRAIANSVRNTVGYSVSLFLPDSQNRIVGPYAGTDAVAFGEDEVRVAAWSYQYRKEAGRGTDTFYDARALYVPLITARGALGVMAVLPSDPSSQLAGQQRRLVAAFADLAAVAVERIALAEEARNIQISQAATERLQTALLDSISHDLRTPLASVVGVLSSLQDGLGLDADAVKGLVQVAREQAERLDDSITNLLDMSRIQAGTIRMSREPYDVSDIVSVALDQAGDLTAVRTIKVDVDVGLPFVSADFGLVVKVLHNLLDNAVKYSPADQPVEVKARQVGQEIEIEVADHGPGIPPQDLPHIFHRFYRVPHTAGVPGTGLGLSICKGIVEAHGGHIWAESRPGGGAVVRLTLPVAPESQGKPG